MYNDHVSDIASGGRFDIGRCVVYHIFNTTAVAVRSGRSGHIYGDLSDRRNMALAWAGWTSASVITLTLAVLLAIR